MTVRQWPNSEVKQLQIIDYFFELVIIKFKIKNRPLMRLSVYA